MNGINCVIVMGVDGMYRLKVCSVEEMRRIDAVAAESFGVSHLLLMEDAGDAVYNVIFREVGVSGKSFVVVAGTGNNGGDALATARRLYANGGLVSIFIVGDSSKYPEPAKVNYEIITKLGLPVTLISDESVLNKFREVVQRADVIVVGVFGVGLNREVVGIHRAVLEEVNKSGKVIVSIDIPSGINGNNGKVYGVAVKSTYTVTFGLPKYGNILYPGYYYCGRLYVSHLSYPMHLYDEVRAELNVPIRLKERVRWGHKGVFGKFLAVSGSRNYYGAPYYVSYSFLKAGGGYSRLAAPKSIIPFIASRASEVVYIPLNETVEGSIAKDNYDFILKIIDDYDIDIVALGPGASLNDETQQLIRELTRVISKPVIIDGDGITAVSKDLSCIKSRRAPTILTPHLGEFSRLSGLEINSILDDPIGVLRKLAKELNSYVILKGAHTLISYPDGYVYINMTGNPGMAKAGSGDVLTGTIAAMYGIGYKDVGEALRMGVLIHGLAGDLAAEKMGEDGITPDDILNYLPNALRVLRENPEHIIERYMPKIL